MLRKQNYAGSTASTDVKTEMNTLNHTYSQAQQAKERLDKAQEIASKNGERLSREQIKYEELSKKFIQVFGAIDLTQIRDLLLFAKTQKAKDASPLKVDNTKQSKLQKELEVK